MFIRILRLLAVLLIYEFSLSFSNVLFLCFWLLFGFRFKVRCVLFLFFSCCFGLFDFTLVGFGVVYVHFSNNPLTLFFLNP